VTFLRPLFLAFSLISVAFYAARFWSVFAAGELFHRLGFDWSLFYAQAMAVRAGAGASMYEPAEIDLYLQPLLRYYGGPATALTGWPQPYPPWLAAAVVPFTLPPAPVGFALWLGASVLAALFLAYRVWQFLPNLGPVGAAAAVLATVPVAWGLFLGQPTVLLAIPVGEMLISFNACKDLRAGLWLAVLLLKPQYALLFGVWILWKQRWHALTGAVVGGLAFVGIGVLAAGVPSLVRFPIAIAAMSDLRNEVAGPLVMMNWRAMVLAFLPDIDEHPGVVLVWVASSLTMIVSLLVWRGKWDPDEPSFGARFCALTLGALIGSWHSHLHGAALLIVPIAAAWATPAVKTTTRVALWAAVYAPTFFVVWRFVVVDHLAVSPDPNVPLWTVWPGFLPAAMFLVAFGRLCRDLWGLRVPVQWRPGHSPVRVT
jgi:hypothetical protein